MYIPKPFEQNDLKKISGFLQQYPFGILISTENNRPVATHIPFVMKQEGEKLVLYSHFSKANTQGQTLDQEEVLCIFSEPHAYISPQLYNNQDQAPTWNYIAVHAYGKVEKKTKYEEVLSILEEMIHTFDPVYQERWPQVSADYKQKMIKGIIAFRIEVTDLQAKEKMSQNKKLEEQKRIQEYLAHQEDSVESQLGTHMKENLHER